MRTLRFITCLALLVLPHVGVSQRATVTYNFSVAVQDLEPEDDTINIIPVSVPTFFPALMIRAGVSGDATLRFLVKEEGTVAEVILIKTNLSEYGEAAKEAASKWKFQTRDWSNKAAPTSQKAWMTCRVIFKIEPTAVERMINKP